jgi:hypothetical protein
LKRSYLVAIALLLWSAALISNTAYRKRMQSRAILEDRADEYRSAKVKPQYVDIGVVFRVVVADRGGVELLPGRPKLRVIHESEHGGILDTKAEHAQLVGKSRAPRLWYCSEQQYEILQHGDELTLGLVAYGSEGAGKTALLPYWHYMRWLEHLGEGREGGQTAPTKRRLKMFKDAFFGVWPREWVHKYTKSDGLIQLCDGRTLETRTRIQLIQTHVQSAAAGSPVQGYNWSWCGSDEFQDSYERAADIDARGRSAEQDEHGNALYKQLRTCTAKDTTAWREFKDTMLSAQLEGTGGRLFSLRKLLGRSSPFVAPGHWDALRAKLSPREYARRVEPLDDQPPELAVYYCWQRDRNLVALPRIGTIDVTPAILSGYQSYKAPSCRFTLLACHDPGNIFNTTEVLRLVMFGDEPTWIVVGELQTKQTTAAQHAQLFREYVNKRFGVEGRVYQRGKALIDTDTSKVAIFIDPHGKGEGQTDYQTHYGAFQAEGLDAFSPAALTGKIKRSARVEMVNRLLGAANGLARLLIGKATEAGLVAWDTDARQWKTLQAGESLAPCLVEAFESLVKKPGDDDPEGTRRKDEADKTHAPAALGYGLWSFEQQAITDITIEQARTAARRLRV